MRILVINAAPLGDTLFTTPALRALRTGYPEAEIEVLAEEASADILKGNDSFDSLHLARGWAGLLQKVLSLRSEHFDLVAGLSRAGCLTLPLVRAADKAGFMSSTLDRWYSISLPDDRGVHAVDYCLQIARAAGGVMQKSPRLELPVFPTERKRAAKLLAAGPLSVTGDRGPVALHPGGKFFSFKKWPEGKFSRLIKMLDEHGMWSVIIGGGGEKEIARRIIGDRENYQLPPLNLCGELSLKETAAVLEKCSLFIGNDSAPMHMAAAAGLPVVALFGPTAEKNFHPYGTEYRVVAGERDCRPCFRWLGELRQYLPEYLPEWVSGCDGACMCDINVEQVLAAAEDLLAAGQGTKNRV